MKKGYLSVLVCIFVITVVCLCTIINININLYPTKVEYKNFPNKYVGEFTITHYCSCPKCTGTPKGSKTSSGHTPKEGRTIAVDTSVIPLHSIVYIENVGYFVAEDIGGAIKKNHIDIYVDNHEKAVKLGNKKKKVYILEE